MDFRRLPLPVLVVAAVVPLVLLAILGLVLLTRDAPVGAEVGRPAPDFSLADLDGNPVRLADLRGRPVVVNFWASWCGPCVEEFPLLRRALEEHAASGLAVIGVVYRDGSEAAREFMARLEAPWPAVMDPGEEVASRYAIYGPPETFFIDADGVVRARHIGQFTQSSFDDALAAIIAAP